MPGEAFLCARRGTCVSCHTRPLCTRATYCWRAWCTPCLSTRAQAGRPRARPHAVHKLTCRCGGRLRRDRRARHSRRSRGWLEGARRCGRGRLRRRPSGRLGRGGHRPGRGGKHLRAQRRAGLELCRDQRGAVGLPRLLPQACPVRHVAGVGMVTLASPCAVCKPRSHGRAHATSRGVWQDWAGGAGTESRAMHTGRVPTSHRSHMPHTPPLTP